MCRSAKDTILVFEPQIKFFQRFKTPVVITRSDGVATSEIQAMASLGEGRYAPDS